MLEDFGSLNGTFVNGQRVQVASLKPGDSVAIGKHTIIVTESQKETPWARRSAEMSKLVAEFSNFTHR
jgi:pSer/pThr/pTyr-binding forkhead associated (FHA) protein